MKNIKLYLNTLLILIIIYLCSLLISTYIIPTIRIYDDSMNPNLNKNDIMIYKKTNKIEKGDLVAFYVDDKLLIKRCVATSNDNVNIDDDGNLYINDKLVEEKYTINKSYGKVSIDLPFKVENGKIFILSDDRNDPSDSRNVLIGSVDKSQIVGKLIYRIYPLKKIGKIK